MFRLRNYLVLLLVLFPSNSYAVSAGVEEAKSIARLYCAAFDRTPAANGLNFWVDAYEAGRSLDAIAGDFCDSPEFTARYGSLSDEQYIEQLYRNVLGRSGEQQGVDFWMGHLANGTSRARVLAAFANAPETIEKTSEIFAYMRVTNCQWSFGPEQAVSANTGFLVGPAVSGVTYETPTHRCVTGPDGDFQYEAGETVRFTVGDTLLGEIVGQQQVTPFDLAGSPAHTGIDITWALQDENDPFNAAVNIAVFLQSLDDDADPENGIEIDPGVAALLHKVKLDIRRPWEEYPSADWWRSQSDVVFRHLLGRANREQHFSVSHGAVKRATAIANLYSALEIDPQTVGLVALDRNNDSMETWQYDANGNFIRHANTAFGDAFEAWQYNSSGNVIHHEVHPPNGHIVETWQYDTNGRLTGFEIETSGGTHEASSYVYDPDGNRTQATMVRFRDEGDVEITTSYEYGYDRHGNLRQFAQGDDADADGVVDSGEISRYDANGNLTQFGFLNEDGTVNIGFTWRYDASGNLLAQDDGEESHTMEYDADGKVIRSRSQTWNGVWVAEYFYDTNNKLIRRESVNENDSSKFEIETWQYDDSGNVTYREEIETGDALVEETETWQYTETGNLMVRERVRKQDGAVVAFETRQYDDLGRIILWECADDRCEDESDAVTRNRTHTWQYHANGKVSLHKIIGERWIGEEGEFQIPATWWLHYNADGNLTREEIDSSSDGTSDRILTWQYDADGNLTRYELDDTGDGWVADFSTYQYESTEWGHLFSGIEMYGQMYVHSHPPTSKPKPERYE